MRIYYNGKIYTGSGFAEAFAVENGRFVAAGGSAELLYAYPEAEKTDLNGGFVCPGFNDSHMHLLNYGQVLLSAPLYAHTGSLAEVLACMKRQLEQYPPAEGQWLTGRGWNQDYFTDVNRMPNRRDLDEVSADIPVMITRACGHCCVVNSKALLLAGIGPDAPAVEGGAIGFENGEPDGRFFDNAMDLVLKRMPPPDKEGLKRLIVSACRELNRYGITSCQSDDYCVFREIPPETVNEAYAELEASGELTVRVYEQCNFTDPGELARFIGEGNVTGAGSDMFRIGPLKLLGDGALGSRTAHLSMPYLNAPGSRGFSLFSPEHMNKMISYAHRHGMQIAVHAIGDACLDMVLDAFEAALREQPRPDHRHGVIHCQITRKDQLERMARLRLHIYAQSIFLDYDNHIVRSLVAKELADTSYNWKTLMDLGLVVSNGSDCPVELPDVMKGVECAVTRTSMDGTGPYLPDQAFTVREAIDSFTANGAHASFEEAQKGRIAPGMLADFTILDGDPFAAEARRIHEIGVKAAFLGGRQVYPFIGGTTRGEVK